MTRMHPDYTPDVELAEQQAPVATEVAFSLLLEPDELVLLHALCFLRGCDEGEAAVEAFNDLFRWCREQPAIQTLLDLRDQWAGQLVEGGVVPDADGDVITTDEDGDEVVVPLGSIAQ